MLVAVQSIRTQVLDNPMRSILQVSNGTVFDEGMLNLLRDEADWRVSAVAFVDELTFLRNVIETRPDVIVFNEAGPLYLARIFELLMSLPFRSVLRIVVVRVNSNTIDLYERRQVIMQQRTDFATLIRSSVEETK
jgi:hypothetical protein